MIFFVTLFLKVYKMRFPYFDTDRERFVRFVQGNKDVFDTLLFSGKYYLTRGLNTQLINEGYCFMRSVNLSDDANLGALLYQLCDFNDGIHTDIHLIVDAFVSWFEHDLTRKYLSKELKMRRYSEMIDKEKEQGRNAQSVE